MYSPREYSEEGVYTTTYKIYLLQLVKPEESFYKKTIRDQLQEDKRQVKGWEQK